MTALVHNWWAVALRGLIALGLRLRGHAEPIAAPGGG